jgi:hypothetical protein
VKKKLLFIILIFVSMSFSQDFTTRFCMGYTPLAGFEIGFLGESDVPKLQFLKISTRGSLGYKYLVNNDFYTGTIYGSFQAGGKFKLLNNKFNPSAGFSFNPLLPFRKDSGQMDAMFAGFGPFIGISTTIGNVEPCLILTYSSSCEDIHSTIYWLTFLISKSF